MTHPHLTELLSKVLKIKLDVKEIDNSQFEYLLDPESVKSAYPMMVYEIDGKEVVNTQQITLYLLGCVQELYNQLYNTQDELQKIKTQLEKLTPSGTTTPSDK